MNQPGVATGESIPDLRKAGRPKRWSAGPLTIALGLAIGAVTIGVATVFDRVTYDVIVGAIVLLVLIAITIPQLQWISRKENDDQLFRILVVAFIAKLIFSLIRYYVITVAYGDNADAGVYSEAASKLAESLRSGRFTLIPPGLEGRPAESQRVAVVLSFFYILTGNTRYGGTFIFTWLCFQGQLLMCAAFKMAVPKGDIRRYRLLVLFMPSMLFWPSSIGKEALMIAAIGLVSYGAAYILSAKARLSGVAIFLAGVTGLMFIRPHMAMIAIAGVGFAAAIGSIRSMRDRGATRSASVRLGALIVLMGAAVVGATQLTAFFGTGTDGVSGVLASTTNQTSTGGSEFVPTAVDNPIMLIPATITVFLRPFPWEAGNVNGIIASFEGVLLAALMFKGRNRLKNLPRAIVDAPYLAFAATYALIFVIAFSYIGNFGILARQRTQMMPLALTALAIPPTAASLATTMERRGRKKRKRSESVAAPRDVEAVNADRGYLSKLAETVPEPEAADPFERPPARNGTEDREPERAP